MIHVWRKGNRVTRKVLCFRPEGRVKLGKATHQYNAELCGFDITRMSNGAGHYFGPIKACVNCHRHFWYDRWDACPTCGHQLVPGGQPIAPSPSYLLRPTYGSSVQSQGRF